MNNPKKPTLATGKSAVVSVGSPPASCLITGRGESASKRFLEFFAWCEDNRAERLEDIEPMHVVAYIEYGPTTYEKPTAKQHLATIRMPFDWLVAGQVGARNPAAAVRGPRHVVIKGKTDEG